MAETLEQRVDRLERVAMQLREANMSLVVAILNLLEIPRGSVTETDVVDQVASAFRSLKEVRVELVGESDNAPD